MTGSKPINHVAEIQALFIKLKANQHKQDKLKEEESVYRIQLQKLYNQQSKLDKGSEIS